MDGWVEKVLASWVGIVIFGCLTILEFVGKCVSVVDAVMDSAMTFVVPILSVLGSFASFGLFTAPSSSTSASFSMDEQHGNHTLGIQYEYEQDVSSVLSDDGGTNGFLIFLKIILTCLGIILALLVHLFKLLLRSMGEGCCTCCITVVEYSWIICSVTLCVFIVPIAIGAAVILIVAAGFGFKSWWEKRQKKKREAAAATGGGVNVSPSGQRQDEEQGTQQQNEENVTAEEEPSTNPSYSKTAEDVSRDELQEPLLQK